MKKLIFYTVLLFIIVNIIYLKLSFSFLIRQEIIFIYMLIGFGILLLVFSLYRKHKKLKLYSLILIIITSITLFSGEAIKSYQLETTKSRVDKVKNSLEEYFKNEQSYPNELIVLSPKYIDEIPKYVVGFSPDEFYYKKKNGYYIIGYIDFLNTRYYNSKSDSWILVD